MPRPRMLRSAVLTLLLLLASGCFAPGRFQRRMNALIGHDMSLLIAAWGEPHQRERCREIQRRWDLQRKQLMRRVCAWEEEGMTAFMWTLVEPSYDERQATPADLRLTLPCSVVVVVAANGRIHAWEIAPNQQCSDYRAVNAVPVPPNPPDSSRS